MAVITASPNNFSRLLELQKLSTDHLDAINTNIAESLVYERLQALEQLAMANELDKQEDETSRIEKVLGDILDTLKSNIASISNTNITTNQQQSSTLVNKSSSNSSTALITQTEEDKKEQDAVDKQVISLLKEIAKNTTPSVITSKASTEGEGVSLGGIATAIAVALAAVVAAIKSQVKAIRYFLDLLVPDKLTAALAKNIASFLAGLSMQFDLIKASVAERLSGVTKIFDNVIDWVKGLFATTKESKLVGAVSEFFSFIGKALAPFVEAGKAIIGFISGPISTGIETVKGVFSSIGNWFTEFGSKVGKIAVVLEKFMLPLTIIMTVWDTVKGAIEGFEKEGIIGGIKGAITGFFNSLIFGPIDMLKNAVAWVMGFFGFDKAKEALESFSVEKIFKDFIDMIFKPIDTFKAVVAKFMGFFDTLKDFEIPGVSYTIPSWVPFWGGKEKGFGPWRPFAKDAPKVEQSSSASPSSAPIASSVAPSTTSTSSDVAERSSNVTAMKEDASKKSNNTAVVAPSVNNNVNTTQVATLRAPVRSADPSFDRYVSSRVVM